MYMVYKEPSMEVKSSDLPTIDKYCRKGCDETTLKRRKNQIFKQNKKKEENFRILEFFEF